ncbi:MULTISPECIES: uracil-DNA glycosylase family protein [unclassified Haladaptatus]|uniref:uracil-DNA glycosylase family protein n=1 Tax=unclassified Haladaptatus TaxID=2622732 RepID=UPI0023E76E47|nr:MULTISPECIES: uracil-DNA glycosylase family protein [unclassified Haladaptatus]
MQNITDRTRNPFGMRTPPEYAETAAQTVFGYGDANADFHLIGDHPGVHGGRKTGVPFTGGVAGKRLQPILHELGFLADAYDDEPRPTNLYCSYIHMCTVDDGETPTRAQYDALERYFDAELRAINGHILMPVGEQATRHVVREYTTQERHLDFDMAALHGNDVRGGGFLVFPIRDPTEWEDGDAEYLETKLRALLNSDYRQTKGVATMIG